MFLTCLLCNKCSHSHVPMQTSLFKGTGDLSWLCISWTTSLSPRPIFTQLPAHNFPRTSQRLQILKYVNSSDNLPASPTLVLATDCSILANNNSLFPVSQTREQLILLDFSLFSHNTSQSNSKSYSSTCGMHAKFNCFSHFHWHQTTVGVLSFTNKHQIMSFPCSKPPITLRRKT